MTPEEQAKVIYWGDGNDKSDLAIIQRIADALEAMQIEKQSAEAECEYFQKELETVGAENEKWQDDYLKLQAEADALRQELESTKALSNSLVPCGHLASLSYTEDGGKHIYCYACQAAALRQRVEELEKTIWREAVLFADKAKELEQQLAAARVEVLRRAKEIMGEHIPGDHEVFDAIDAEIAALERGKDGK